MATEIYTAKAILIVRPASHTSLSLSPFLSLSPLPHSLSLSDGEKRPFLLSTLIFRLSFVRTVF